MPHRIQIQMACQRCRKKRAKCDGEVPCKRCDEAGQGCVYNHTRRKSKDDLRAEVDRLRRYNDRLLRAFHCIKDVEGSNAFIQGLVEGTKSRRADLQELAHLDGESRCRSSDGGEQEAAAGSYSILDKVACPSCPSRLPSPTMHRSASGSSDLSTLPKVPKATLAPALATPISLSLFSFGDTSYAKTSGWTCAGRVVASVQQLLDALFTYDYLPFCLMCKEPFLRDYYSGSNRYCSSALVNALLALATRVVHENSDETESPRPGLECGSKPFFDEAETIIRKTSSSTNIPDTQAIGILSLYQIICGREADAQALANSFTARITGLCLQEPPVGSEAEEYARIQASLYYGAVSLTRILRLTTGHVFSTSSNYKVQDDSIFLYQSPGAEYLFGGQCGSEVAVDFALDSRDSQLRNLRLIPARLFQLTEWVYKLSIHTPNEQFDTAKVMAVYTSCLEWYEGLFPLLKTDGSDTPFVLFIHMYYHFCLLCLFRPLANLILAGSDIRPREICLQAAQSILALSQSYSRLFTLKRISAFIPYFVYASGLAGLTLDSICNGLTLGGSQHVPPKKFPLATTSNSSSVDRVGTYQDVSPSPTVDKISIVAHASRLLAEMSSSHRIASSAEKMLRRYSPKNDLSWQV